MMSPWWARLGLALIVAAMAGCGDSSNGSIDQKDTSSPELGLDTGAGTEDTEVAVETDTSPPGDTDTDPADVTDTTTPGDTTAPDADEETEVWEVTDADDVSEVAIEDEVTPPPDTDADGVLDADDLCPEGARNWPSNPETDHDGDGCRDSDEDTDDDNDGIGDADDACPRGLLSGPDHDVDGCRDDEDEDDDNDGAPDEYDECPRGATNWISSPATDGDNDGCRDSDEDFDLDGDGAPDDVDTCPGLFDPEQIDASPPFGPGEGDLCAFGCQTLTWVEYLHADPSAPMSVTFPSAGGQPTFLLEPYVRSAFFTGAGFHKVFQDNQVYHSLPGRLEYIRVRRPRDGTDCLVGRSTSAAPANFPIRIEISAPGTVIADLDGGPDISTLLVPGNAALLDRDGDGLFEPWEPSKHLQYNTSDGLVGEPLYFGARDSVSTSYTVRSQTLVTEAYGVEQVSMNSTVGFHLYVAGPYWTQGASGNGRLRVLIDESIALDLEVQSVPVGTVTYIGEFIMNPRLFVLRKRCVVSNTLCTADADCASGPCIFRSFPSTP